MPQPYPFGRVITAMITPFNAEGQVAYDIAQSLAVHLVEQGSDGLVICGTTGESPTLTWEEELQLFRAVKEAVGDRAAVIAGTGSNCTREAIAATQSAATLGLNGSLQVVPYYNKPPQEGLYAHFRAIAEACPDLPLMLYNIPGRTGQSLQPETVARLASLPNVVAIKAASGNVEEVSALRQLLPDSFAIYSGDDSLTLPMLAVGAQGVVSVASHLVGPQLQALIQAFEAGNVARAQQLHHQLYPLFKALFLTTNPIPVRAAMELLGWSIGLPRLPLVPASAEIRQALASCLTELGLYTA
ncbi:4-hydroxy-tetrahydrodipicolinate synthase [Synechococcus elongatus]|uniref:4-hydroxy-tetrahydrodipicolinate synthase n=2 Tax=Synechococcus elongatus TaxID=32046 RepID=DAPA_SYNE7|nr:4-hydroxy-tetrahydrodipicolinate synthase [Synechococcus elongatus]Q31M42.1 RecName: Full=4-hydroxy-tetrahydrodipicolinate synthase; Short=HTPA synthase [Synechococcus elongatus PCC 7942 = FACHB-805]Q5MZT3.1 RecName: Full=4-hydroxy-tetrahydrodipicolinate synthase; Short=HTPA synthase [Synechococcus elongatus PCC 6301]ABB57877.1 dihydrodipicolinate synthase [Synechococcus elongatus PCC 7942 = FACHB-805]AJD57641.1 dihydrodipicolinate synthase [Synechococcus elongatus UTEX 2973]MBD2586593.1 4-